MHIPGTVPVAPYAGLGVGADYGAAVLHLDHICLGGFGHERGVSCCRSRQEYPEIAASVIIAPGTVCLHAIALIEIRILLLKLLCCHAPVVGIIGIEIPEVDGGVTSPVAGGKGCVGILDGAVGINGKGNGHPFGVIPQHILEEEICRFYHAVVQERKAVHRIRIGGYGSVLRVHLCPLA